MKNHTICTYLGIEFDVFNPTPDMVDIRDIAHALSFRCRMNGYTKKFYSVADHSLLMASHIYAGYRLEALLHDAHEAYLVDLPSPIRNKLVEMGITIFEELADRVQEVIAKKFCIAHPTPEMVNVHDHRSFLTELECLMPLGVTWAVATEERSYKQDIILRDPVLTELEFLRLYDAIKRNPY